MNVKTALSAAALVASACGPGETSSAVFSDAKQITLTSPLACKKFVVSPAAEEDSFRFSRAEKTPGIEERRVFAALFKDTPQVQAGRIVNPEDSLWVWHSGMRSEASPAAGTLRFSDGTGTNAGVPASLKSCGKEENCPQLLAQFDLTSQRHYHFVMWAWDEDREISYFSDQSIEFCLTDQVGERGKDCPTPCR